MISRYPKEDLLAICAYYEANDLQLDSSTFLITGATGFIGSWLTEALITLSLEFDLGIEITCVCRDLRKADDLSQRLQGFPLSIVETDLRELKSLPQYFSHIIHAATPTTQASRGQDVENVIESSVTGAKKLLQNLVPTSTPPVFLHTSSGAVYGEQPWDLEKFPTSFPTQQPKSLNSIKDRYAFAKLETERVISEADMQGRILGINARLFAFMGPGLPLYEHFAIGNFMSGALKEGVVKVKGNGKTVRSYLYASEMTMQILYLMSERIAGVSHVGSGDGHDLKHWAEMVGKVWSAPILILNDENDVPSRYVPEWDSRIPRGLNSEASDPRLIERWGNWILNEQK